MNMKVFMKFFRKFSPSFCQTWCSTSSHPGDEAVTHVFRKLLVVHQLLQEDAAETQRDRKEGEEEMKKRKEREERTRNSRRATGGSHLLWKS